MGIDFDLFPQKYKNEPFKKIAKFVYIGALNSNRNITELVQAFARFVAHHDYGQTLDLYGSGGEKQLLDFIKANQFSHFINYKGLLPQAELFSNLTEYDCGLAWVPCKVYDTSPSLKLIEYMAAGLKVLATKTIAHQEMSKKGFIFSLAGDNNIEFADGLIALSEQKESFECNDINLSLIHI